MQSFKKLRLPGMAACYREILDGNEQMGNMDVATLMERFVNAELLRRGDRKTAVMIGQARLWYPSGDLSNLKGRNAMLGIQMVCSLSKCGFIGARGHSSSSTAVPRAGRPTSAAPLCECQGVFSLIG
jgi:hypothetical protein